MQKKTINLFVSIFKGSDSAASLSLDDLDDSLIVDSQLVNQSAPIPTLIFPSREHQHLLVGTSTVTITVRVTISPF